MEPFWRRADRIVRTARKERGISPEELLVRIGMPAEGKEYRKFRRWFEAPNKLPAERIGLLCKTLKNYELLDILEEQAGRAGAFVPETPQEETLKMGDVEAILRFVTKVADALRRLSEALEHGSVDDSKLEPGLKELNSLIAECVHLKHLLHRRHEEWRSRAYPKAVTRKPVKEQ